jgi:hypothetical protein
MAGLPVDKELAWDNVTKAVAMTAAEHIPEATSTEAYYYMVMHHLSHVLWRLNAGDRALYALAGVWREAARDIRPLVVRAGTGRPVEVPPPTGQESEATA